MQHADDVRDWNKVVLQGAALMNDPDGLHWHCGHAAQPRGVNLKVNIWDACRIRFGRLHLRRWAS